MAITFLEPGGDATFGLGLFSTFGGTPAVATDFVHGGHIKSIKFKPNNPDSILPLINTSSNSYNGAGARVSFYIYFVTFPTSIPGVSTIVRVKDNGGNLCFALKITHAGVLQLFETTNQIGSDGATLSTGVWYRISIADTISSTSVNEFRVFKDATQTISVTNATLTRTLTDGVFNSFLIGNIEGDSNLDFRISDFYIDDSSSLADTGDVWVTAKRPNANGTTNGFSTQIGSGGSGYGTGHSPQVNERPNSDSNGWSVVGAGSAVTEEYNVEGTSVGDIDISNATIKDYVGWVRSDSLVNETGQIIVNNVTANINILSSQKSYFSKVAGSTSYPAGSGTDIGIITSTDLTTVSLYECGIVIAYIPGSVATLNTFGLATPQFRRQLRVSSY